MAQRYAYGASAQLLYRPAEGPPFFEQWDRARDTADHDLLGAEMSRLAYASRDTAASSLSAIGFTLSDWFGGDTLKKRRATRGTDGFVATNEAAGLTVLAFRGTEANRPEDLLADGFADWMPWNGPGGERSGRVSLGRVHRGFAHAYAPVRQPIADALSRRRGALLITGHSLGAAIATLAAADHADRNPELITFGSPRVGDEAFAGDLLARLETVRRFVDCCDVVTRVPPERFDAPHIEQLLVDLLPAPLGDDPVAGAALRAAASWLADSLRALDLQPHYAHAGAAIYRDREGNPLSSTAPPDAIAADQRAARAAYQGSLTPNLVRLFTSLRSRTAVRDGKSLGDRVRRVGTGLFQGDPVPLRDLADHAPLNYVSLFAGRRTDS